MNWVRKQTAEFDARWDYLYSLTQSDLSAWLVAINGYARVLHEHTPLADIENAVITGQPDTAALNTADADNTLLATATERIAAITGRAAESEIARLKFGFTFRLDNPFVYQWINSHGAELVVQVTDQTRGAIRTVISEAFRNGDPPRRAALRIRNLIGLTERDAKAVLNRWRQLASDGSVSGKRADEMADTYAARLLRRRALNIARTETVNSAAKGVQLSWQEAKSQGFLLPGVMQEWIAAIESTRTCPICLELDGQQVPVGQQFYSARLGRWLAGPTAHSSCRCAVGLVTAIA